MATGPQRVCQLETFGEIGDTPYVLHPKLLRFRRLWARTKVRLLKVARDPVWGLRRLARSPETPSAFVRDDSMVGATASLRLQAGERVRVKTVMEVARTLDTDGKHKGMTYLPAVMDRFAGRTFTVRKRVDHFFDERNWRMLHLSDSVILDEVFCEPEEHVDCEYAGCQRTCFLFWKEAWLERVGDPEHSS